MKILFAADVNPNPNSGAAGTEYQTIRALKRLGHEVDEIWAEDLPHRIKHGNLHYLFELPKGYRDTIRRKCEKKTYDIIHVNQGHCFLAAKDHLKSNRLGAFVMRSHGLDDHMERVLRPWRRKLGIENRTSVKKIPGRLIDWKLYRHDKLAYQAVSGIIVSNSLDFEYLILCKKFPKERLACIHQAPTDELLSNSKPYEIDRLRRILYVGGFGYWKAPFTVAEVANRILHEFPDVIFTWICDKTDHLKVLQLLDSEIQYRINLIGWLPQRDLCCIYDKHGIFVYPPLFDGFGKVFLEAMARGMCVIATRTGGMRDIIIDNQNGFFVNFNDPNDILAHIRYLFENPEIAVQTSKKARQTAEKFTWLRVAKQTASFYEQLLTLPQRH